MTALSFDILGRDKASQAFDKVGKAADRTEKKFGFLAARSHGLTAGITAGFGKIAGAMVAVAGISAFKGFIDEARESRKVGALTQSIIKSTGGAAKISAGQVGDLATAISNKTGADDEAVQSGSNLLLTFKNVRNEVGKGANIFDRATQAAVDLSAAGFGDINGASKMLGKALNDPIKGITALGKAGVTFTDQQKKQIKTLVETGDVLGAQKIILKEVESQVGGAAAASADPLQKLGVILGNTKEAIGGAFLPVVDKAAGFLGRVIPAAVSKTTIGVEALGAAFEGEGVTSSGFVGVMERIGVVARKVFDVFQSSVLPRLKDFGGFITGTIIPAVVSFGGFVKDKVTTVVIPAVKDLVATFGPLVVEIGGKLVNAVKDLTPKVIALGKSIADKVGPAILAVTGFFREHQVAVRAVAVGIGAAVLAFKGFQVVTGIISGVKGALLAIRGAMIAVNAAMAANPIGLVIAALVGLAAGLIYAYKHSEKFREIVNTIGGALKTAWLAVVDFGKGVIQWFKDLPSTISTALGDLGSWLSQSGRDLIDGLLGGAGSVLSDVGSWLKAHLVDPIVNGVKSLFGIKSPSKVFAQIGGFLMQGLLGGILSVAKSVGGWLLRNVVAPVLGAFAKSGQWLVQGGRNAIAGFTAGISAFLAGIKGIGSWIYNKVIVPAVTPFAKAASWLATAGGHLISGMLGGIVGAMKNIGSWIKSNIIDPVVNAVKKFFGIASPSKVFTEIGGHLVGGLLKGLSSGNPAAFVKKIFGGMPDALRAIVGKGIVAIQDLPQKALEALGAVDKAIGSVPLATGMAKLVQGIAASFGWGSGDQWNALYKLIQGESGFRPNAQNPTSSAYGLFQFLDSTWGTVGGHKTSDPTLQTIYGLKYIQSAYGSPANAYAKWSARSPHWYEKGTPWVPNDQFAYLHKGEAVLPRKVNEARMAASRSMRVRTPEQRVVLEFRSDGTSEMDDLIKRVRKYVKVNGGDVQMVLGRG